ncbi:hypothetical protein DPMN_140793 [Dreissena polymorpha]|uniref:Uncharacterized protein n=1 Tax=Dreissena polymorpha TaxID=45954 RepID=A0A9D4G8D5_DREPO|nr:hypothetical protein DPMN_140793 [Dreissena polymorpha]
MTWARHIYDVRTSYLSRAHVIATTCARHSYDATFRDLGNILTSLFDILSPLGAFFHLEKWKQLLTCRRVSPRCKDVILKGNFGWTRTMLRDRVVIRDVQY